MVSTMKAGRPRQRDNEAASGVPFPWGSILRVLAAAAFLYMLARTRHPMALVNAALATIIALVYAAQQEQGLARRGAIGWCLCFGMWTSALFGLLLPRLFLPPALPGAGSGPGALLGVIIMLVLLGGILLLFMWPYARRVVGLAQRPLWADEQPALHLAVVTILALFMVGAIIRLVRMITAP